MAEKKIYETLDQIEKGQTAVVRSVPENAELAERMKVMGLAEGTEVTCVEVSFFGDPAAYLVRGAVVAIRGADARQIKIEKEQAVHIAFAGNPNVGKSTLFNRFTGLHQHTGNWCGKTVELAEGQCVHHGKVYTMTDLPGCYSLNGQTAEEKIAEEYIKSGQADGVVVVCDATCLERNLYLVLQILEITDRVVVCVNLMDEAVKRRMKVDLEKLQTCLGVPVVGTVARRRGSLKKVLDALEKVCFTDEVQDAMTEKQLNDTNVVIKRAEEICQAVVVCRKEDVNVTDRRWDRIFMGKYTAVPTMLLFLMGIFWLTMEGANYPSLLLSKLFFWIEGKLAKGCQVLGVSGWLYEPLVFGIYRVLAWVVSVMLPPMAVFFPLFTLLEDFGYLPRVAFHMDKCFQKCHACGKQALTMCMGFGCNAVGVTGCRIIHSPRERLIAILTNSLVPCNGRFPLLVVMISMFFAGGVRQMLFLTGFILLGVLMTFGVSKLLSVTILRGMPSSFTMELPPYRRPQIGKVVLHSLCNRTLFVLGRAVTVAAPAGLVIWLLANIVIGNQPMLRYCTDFLDPFARMLGLDGVIFMAFILGFPANEIVIPIIIMTYMSQGTLIEIGEVGALRELLVANGWTQATALCTMLFSLIHWPCSTTLLTIRKETGSWKWCVAAFLIPTVLGMLLCCAVNIVLG